MSMKLVIFDMDGTIVSTAESYMYSMNQVLKQEGLPVHDLESYIKWMGGGFRNLTMKAIPESKRNEKYIDELTQRMDDVYGQHWDYHLKAYDGIYHLMDALVERGILLAINTNKMDDKAKKIIEELFYNYDFVDIIGKRADIPNKPDPFAARLIMKKAKVTPKETMYVGDSQYDVETAINAGAIPVAVKWGYRDESVLQKAKYLLNHPMELLEYIG